MPEVLQFDAESHTYTAGGRVVPSVTQLLGKYGVVDDTWFNPESRIRGRHVHTATQLIDEHRLDWGSIDPKIRAYVEAYKRFRREVDLTIDLIESASYDPKRWYAGTLDRTAWYHGNLILFDIKTGQKPPWVALQLAAYRNLLKIKEIHISGCFCLNLRGDGTYRFEQIPTIQIVQGWKEFEAITVVDRLGRKYNPKKD